METAVVASAVVDFGVEGLSSILRKLRHWRGTADANSALLIQVLAAWPCTGCFDRRGGLNLGGASPTVQDLIDYIADPVNGLDSEISLAATPQNTADQRVFVFGRLVGSPATTLVAVGDT